MDFDKYEKFGAYHWDEFHNGTVYRTHALRVQEWVVERPVLDIGAGDGLITHLLEPGAKGIDTNELAVSLAQERGVDVTIGDVYDLSTMNQYAAVYLGDVLEHLERPRLALIQIAKITSVLYLSTPPRQGKSLRPYHYQEWTAPELKRFMAHNGWVLDGKISTANDRMYGRFTRESR